jgi:hypothetical protein
VRLALSLHCGSSNGFCSCSGREPLLWSTSSTTVRPVTTWVRIRATIWVCEQGHQQYQ